MSDKLPSGVVNIKGRQYETVALRVSKFRDKHPDYRLITEIVERSDMLVVMRATVQNQAGDILATGHAEEYRKSSEINKTSALENCETSAIGRALASFGLGGTEFASADEVSRAITGAKGTAPIISPVKAALEGVEIDEGVVADHASKIEELAAQPSKEADIALLDYWSSIDNDTKTALWAHWQSESTFRAKLKARLDTTRRIAAQAEKVAA